MSAMYVVQSFIAGKRGQPQSDSPIQAISPSHARSLAQRLAVRKAVVVAFRREGDSKTGAKLIEAFGAVPDEVKEMDRVQ